MKYLKSILAAALLAVASPAIALPITITGEDNFGNTATNTGPSPAIFGPTIIGQWTVAGSAIGAPPAPFGTLLSNTLNFATQGPGTLEIWITQSDLTGPLSPVTYLSSLTSNGFTGPLSAELFTYLQSDNSIPGPSVTEGLLMGSALFTDIGTDVDSFAAITGAGPYSITHRYLITALGAGGANLTIVSTAQVPEPATLALFGFGLLGAGLYYSRRRKYALSA